MCVPPQREGRGAEPKLAVHDARMLHDKKKGTSKPGTRQCSQSCSPARLYSVSHDCTPRKGQRLCRLVNNQAGGIDKGARPRLQ